MSTMTGLKLKLPDGSPPAALSTGLMLFMALIYVVNFVLNINGHISLKPNALLKLDCMF